jgi:hypothetical protein
MIAIADFFITLRLMGDAQSCKVGAQWRRASGRPTISVLIA